ncbi:MAG: hypothetical protein F9K18_13665 [Thermoanaerobaculia bacterium]|nr:MAG: hypothetical protein F9K18_13665 [Thermoanaerobaculia bacterium]
MAEAKLRITIDVFSGRENPVVELSGKRLQQAARRLEPESRESTGEALVPRVPTLGYRGLVVEQFGTRLRGLPSSFRVADGTAFGPGLASRIADGTFEDFVCGSVPKPFPVEDIRRELQRFRELLDFWRRWRWDVILWPKLNPCRCAPLYEPEWWNVPARQPFNNCYNYACDYRTNSFAQPGRAAGAMYAALTCASVKPAAVADELVDSPGADNKCPAEGHLVALVIWPNGDFHWYRKGRDGTWSHKPGGTAVTNLDNSGNPITDPRTADRGPYTDFCTFMVVHHGHVRIQ